MEEKTIKNTVVYDGKIIKVDRDDIEVDGRKSLREVVHNAGGVSVLAITETEEIIFVKQYRYPSKEELLEIPGGKAEKDETYIESGMRELKEETGYSSDNVQYFGYIYPTVAYSDEVIHLLLALDCKYCGAQALDPGEHVEIVKIPLEDSFKKVLNNEIKDGKTIIALMKYYYLKEHKL